MTGRRSASGRDKLVVVQGDVVDEATVSEPSTAAEGAGPGVPDAGDTSLQRRLAPPNREGGSRGLRRNGPNGLAPGGGPGSGTGGGRQMQPRRRHENRTPVDIDELWAPVRYERMGPDREFLPGALAILEAPASPIRIALIYVLSGLVAAALAWSWFGHLDVYADATGKVQASGRTKVVQPVDAGQVIKIEAVDGQTVKAGAVLIRLDPTSALAERNVIRDNLFNARAEVIRHKTEIATEEKPKIDTSPKVEWPSDIPAYVRDREEQQLKSELSSLAATLTNLEAEKSAKVAERDKYKNSIEPQKAVIGLINEHLDMRNQLFKDGWNSRATVLEQEQQLQSAQLQLTNIQGSLAEAEAAIPVIQSQIDLARQTFVTTNTKSLVQSQQQADQLTQDLAKADQKVANMTLTSPIDGVIQASAVTTVGQVVSPGSQLMQVVPEGTPLEIVAYILNIDAGFVKTGDPATIKVDTFPYTRYGTIDGTVTQLATDALTGKQAQDQQKDPSTPPSANGAMSITSAAQQTTDLVFPVTIVPKQTGLMVEGRMRPLTSGMTVTVEIKTESRRAIDYILSPLQSMFEESAQER